MKKLLYVLFALLTFTSAAQAQTAKQILDQTAAKLKKSGGLQATFKVGNFTDGKETGSGSGTIYVKGDKFHIDSPQMKTWFDGKTQWSYLEGSNEVNVSHPTEAELQNINPYTFVNLYKQGYTYSLNHTTLRDKACYEVTLTATSHRQGIRKMILDIDEGTGWPLCIRLTQGQGQWTRISVYDLTAGHRWNDTFFRFNSKDFPQAEIIDLR